MCCLTGADAGADASSLSFPTKSKQETCLELLQDNRNKKIIVYTAFDNIYYQMFEELDKMGLKAERIESNLFSLLRTIKNFQEGQTTILFVSNVDLIRGLSLTATSLLIFYHELSSYEWKQVLLHSVQRLGRVHPLQVLHLNSEIQV
jgi:superfamily II DNA/RNA helicase